MREPEDQENHPSPSPSEQPAGSPDEGEPAFLVVGQLHRPHGVEGEIVFEIITDFPERLRRGVTVYVGPDYRPVKIIQRRSFDRDLLLRFEGFYTPEDVAQLRNQTVYVRADDRPPLPEGEYYHHQLIGLTVVDEDGHILGTLTQILDNTGANDVYVVKPASGPDILLPAIASVILEINLQQQQIRVHVLPGLLPD